MKDFLRKVSIDSIVSVLNEKNYIFFENGKYNLNIIAVRDSDNFTNKFDDYLFVIYRDEWNQFRMISLPWTTLAGTRGFGGEQNPLTGSQTGTGVDGVAIIVEGQYIATYKFINSYWGWLSYPYFQQIADMKYYRDNDKDYKIDRGTIYEGNYFTHLHRMSNKDVKSLWVNYDFSAWSQGCNGSPRPEFSKLVEVTKQSVKIWGDVFSYTLLHKQDFK